MIGHSREVAVWLNEGEISSSSNIRKLTQSGVGSRTKRRSVYCDEVRVRLSLFPGEEKDCEMLLCLDLRNAKYSADLPPCWR